MIREDPAGAVVVRAWPGHRNIGRGSCPKYSYLLACRKALSVCVCGLAFVAVSGSLIYIYRVYLLTSMHRLHPPGRNDKNLCRCFGAPACRVFPDHLLITSIHENLHRPLDIPPLAPASRGPRSCSPSSLPRPRSMLRRPWSASRSRCGPRSPARFLRWPCPP